MSRIPESGIISKIISASNHKIAELCPDISRIYISSREGEGSSHEYISLACRKPEPNRLKNICGLCGLAYFTKDKYQVRYLLEPGRDPCFDRKIVIE